MNFKLIIVAVLAVIAGVSANAHKNEAEQQHNAAEHQNAANQNN